MSPESFPPSVNPPRPSSRLLLPVRFAASPALESCQRQAGGFSDTFHTLRSRIGLVSCRTCDLVFTNPRPSERLLAAFYSGDTYDCHDPNLTSAGGVQADVILSRVTKLLPSAAPKTLLDFGCGAGGFLLSAQQRGWDAQGFEPGRRGIETCRRHGLTVTSDLSALPRDYFGVITLQHVFEHLSNPTAVLSQLRPLLRSDGLLLVQVPNARSLRARFALPSLCARFPVDDRHRAFPIHLMYYLRSHAARYGPESRVGRRNHVYHRTRP